MKLNGLSMVVVVGLAASAVACGSDPGDPDPSTSSGTTTTSSGMGGMTGTGGASTTSGTGGTGGSGAGAPDLTTPAQIEAFLDGKTLTMTGNDIPSHPNGYDENTNFGSATQCYAQTVMVLNGTTFSVVSDLGTLENAPMSGDTGTCNHDVVSATLPFDSTSHVFENIQGNADCFDFNINYNGFAQEGRGAISADGGTLNLELYFKDQAVNMRCADGAVGASGVMVNGQPFAGDAVQVYRITDT